MRISIIGVGLIGGSIGLSSLDRGLANEIAGYDVARERSERALRMGAITEIADSAPDAVRDADLVFIATPVGDIVRSFEVVAPHLKKGAVITDVGSTKARIVAEIGPSVPLGTSFLGGHPFAGSEGEGIESAEPGL